MKAWRDECGVFGVWGDEEASGLTYLGLFALQHRGQESAGIVTLHEGAHLQHKGLGLVGDVFQRDLLDRLTGSAAVGHVRYSTTGENLLANAQPLTAGLKTGPIAVAHNGNIVNAVELREELKNRGSIFQGSNDTEVLLHLLASTSTANLIEALKQSLPRLAGAYSFTILSHKELVGVRDPMGFRPLVLGRKKGAYFLSSETSSFDLIGAEYVREIEPGEIFWVDAQGEHSVRFGDTGVKKARCIFEHVYFARPDSTVFGANVYETRKKLGALLARETPVQADIVVPVPDSGVPAAIGYAAESGIPFELGIIRNHYVGRTFIEPQANIRSFGVKIKLNPQAEVLRGKRVIVIDDSLVRGTTSQKLIGLVRAAGAKEVHLRIAAPPTTGPCFYGVDTPRQSELIASHQSVEDIRKFVGADTLGYLSIPGLMKIAKDMGDGFCAACFDGKYPTPIPEMR